jgi:hypothetical protein
VRRVLAFAAVGILAAVVPAGLAAARGPQASPAATAGGAAGVSAAVGAPRQGGAAGVHPGAATNPGLVAGPQPFTGIRLPDGRTYVLHAPTGTATGARPLVIVLHGLYNTWRSLDLASDWSGYGDRHGLLVAYGVGVGASWNAGTCCGPAHARHVDDVAYLVSVVADMRARYDVDRGRVYVVGFSDGDMMAMRAQCERPDVFAASGGSSGQLVGPCRAPSGQIRVRHLHGLGDTAVPYRGGYSTYTGTSFPAVPLLPRLVAAGAPHPVVATTALRCGHVWPRRNNACQADGTDLIWRWISQFRRGPAVGVQQPPQL